MGRTQEWVSKPRRRTSVPQWSGDSWLAGRDLTGPRGGRSWPRLGILRVGAHSHMAAGGRGTAVRAWRGSSLTLPSVPMGIGLLWGFSRRTKHRLEPKKMVPIADVASCGPLPCTPFSLFLTFAKR